MADRIKTGRILLGLLWGLWLVGCAKDKWEIGRENPEVQIQKCIHLSEKKRYEEAIDCLEIFKSRFADTALGQEAELKIADNYFSQKEYLLAADTYQMFLKLNPIHAKADYALLRTGLSYFKESPKAIDRDQSDLLKAEQFLEAIVRNYLQSPYHQQADETLAQVREKLARRHFYVGRFYYRTGEYRAAIPRFEEVFESYPTSAPSVKSLYYWTLSHLESNQLHKAQEGLSRMESQYGTHPLTKKLAKKMKE